MIDQLVNKIVYELEKLLEENIPSNLHITFNRKNSKQIGFLDAKLDLEYFENLYKGKFIQITSGKIECFYRVSFCESINMNSCLETKKSIQYECLKTYLSFHLNSIKHDICDIEYKFDKCKEYLFANNEIKKTEYAETEGDKVYFISTLDESTIKIGYTKNISSRLSALQTGSPVKLILKGWLYGSSVDEKNLHSKFKKFRLHGEWFDFKKDIKKYIASYCNNDELIQPLGRGE